jgi:hypothetical protein
MSSEEGRSGLNNFTLHWRDEDVVKVAVRLWDGGQRMRVPNGGEGDMLVGKDEDIDAADERVGSRKLVASVK